MTDRQLRRAFNVACFKYGFCILPADCEPISAVPELDAETFARRVIEADGLDPAYSQWMKVLAGVFRESMSKP